MQQRPVRRLVLSFSVLGTLVLAGSCGFGTAGVVSSLGSGGGATNAPATPTSLLVVQPKVSPADIRIVLADAEANDAEVEFLFASAATGGVPQRLTRIAQNPVRLATSREGREQRIAWDFANEPGIATTSLSRGVQLFARIANGVNQDTVVDLGNDAPVVVPEAVTAAEVSGVVPLAVQLADSSSDIATLKVEYRIVGEAEDAWRLARAGGLAASEPTPSVALTNLEATQAPGIRVLFFWDSGHDLPGLERDVVFRYTAADGVATALPVTTAPFRVDNNAGPVVQIQDGVLTEGGDRRRTVSVPFTVSDAESDRVDLVFQWRLAGEAQFQDLGTTDRNELLRKLEDRNFVREKRVCVAAPLWAAGTATRVGDQLRTNAFATDQTWALPLGIVGQPIEILRHANAAPTILSQSWSSNPMARPVAVLGLQRGASFLVLDDRQGGASLLEVRGEDGVVLRTIASAIPGRPTAMCRSLRHSTVFVASTVAGSWSIYEIDLGTGEVAERAAGIAASGDIRGIAAATDHAVLATADIRLLRIDWLDPADLRVATLLNNLAEPYGVVFDPLDGNRILLAERTRNGNGGVWSWDLRTRCPLAVLPLANAPVRPSDIFLDPSGRTLHVLSEPLAGGRVLRRYRLGITGGGSYPAIALPTDTRAIGASDRNGWVAVSADSNQLLAQGGTEEVRTITAYDPATHLLTLDAPVSSASAELHWRIPLGLGRNVPSSPDGAKGRLLWDTTAVSGLGPVTLRVLAFDTELGLPIGESQAGIEYLQEEFDSQSLGSTDIQLVADLDADGDVDVKAGAELHLQSSPRSYNMVSLPSTSGASQVVDWNRDGRNDLIAFGSSPSVWLQNSGGGYTTSPSLLLPGPADRVADLDGDGLLDLVDAPLTGAATIRFQVAPDAWGMQTSLAVPEVPGGEAQYPPDLRIAANELVDVDGDGRIDLTMTLRGLPGSIYGPVYGSVVTYHQGVGGVFPSSPSHALRFGQGSPYGGGSGNPWGLIGAEVVDIDGDGRVDIAARQPQPQCIFCPATTSQLNIAYQSVDGQFGDITIFNLQSAGYLSDGVGDYQGDRLLDFCGQINSFTGVAVEPDIRQVAPRVFFPSTASPRLRSTIDLDADVTADHLAANTLSFARARGVPSAASLVTPGTLIGDFNGDGLYDSARFAISGPSGSSVGLIKVFLQRPTGIYALQPDFTRFLDGGDSPPGASLSQGDINADGISDVLPFQVFDVVATWPFPIVGPTHGGTPATFTGQAFAGGQILVDDIDLDGRNDVCLWHRTQSSFSGQIRIYRSAATDSFADLASLTTSAVPPLVQSAAIGNLTGSPLPDLALATSDGRILVYADVAMGFSTPSIDFAVATGSTPRIGIADLDDDGWQDLVLSTGSNVTIYYGSPGGLQPGVALAQGGAQFADLDGDGFLDMLTGGTCLRQVGPRSFAAYPGTAADQLIDFDYDGELDFVGIGTLRFGGQ